MLVVHLPEPHGREGIDNVANFGFGPIIGPDDLDHIEAAGVLQQAVILQERQRRASESLLAMVIDGFGRLGGEIQPAGLYFDEHHRATVDGNDIDLSVALLEPCGNDPIASTFEKPRSDKLTALAEWFQAEHGA